MKRLDQKPQLHTTDLNEIVIANTSNEFDLSMNTEFYIQL